MTDSPLHVVALVPIDPSRAEEARAALADLVAATRQEEGCLRYDAFESATAPGVFVTIEEWRAQADLDLHMTQPHIATAFEVLGPAIAGDVAIHPLTPLD